MTTMRMGLTAMLLLAAALGMARSPWAGAKQEQEQDHSVKVALDQVPESARTALTHLAGDARIEGVAMEDEDGVKVFEAAWSVSGVAHEASVTEQGDLVELEQAIDLASAPQSVQRRAAKAFPKGAELKVEKKTLVLYEVEAMIGGEERELLFSPMGQSVKIKHRDDDDDDHHAGANRRDDDDDDEADENDDDDDHHGESKRHHDDDDDDDDGGR